jgi:hypothetical protein
MAEKAGHVIEVDSEEEDERSLAWKCLRCVSGSKEAASSLEMLTPQFHWAGLVKQIRLFQAHL